MGKYALYTICGDNYVEPCSIMIYSFLKNNEWFNGDIIVLCDDEICKLNEDNRMAITSIDDKITIKCIEHSEYETLFESTNSVTIQGLVCCWYKFEILRNNNYDRVVFLDSDMIIKDNILEVFENEYDFVCCEDKMSTNNNYFNGGLLSFKGSVCCDELRDRVIDFAINQQPQDFKNRFSWKGKLVEQDVLNEIITKDTIGTIMFYDRDLFNLSQQNEDEQKIELAKIIHYCGGKKPWSDYGHYTSHIFYKRYKDLLFNITEQ